MHVTGIAAVANKESVAHLRPCWMYDIQDIQLLEEVASCGHFCVPVEQERGRLEKRDLRLLEIWQFKLVLAADEA